MKTCIWLLIASLVAFILLMCFASQAEDTFRDIQYGDHLCWAKAQDQTTAQCGTFAYSKSKKVALKMAMKKCQEECQQDCVLDYCEVVKKEKDND